MKNFIGLTVLIVAVCSKLQAQHSEGNPFLRLGYKADVYTFGEKKEFHDQEEIVEIGDVFFNTKTNEVVGFVENNTDSLIELQPELQSMSIDPHCEKYYSISPYVYCMNNPVKLIDPDGKDVYGFDINTGQLSITQHTDDDYDRIMIGNFNKENEFTVTDKDNYLDISKGILLGDYFDDISKSGLVFSEAHLNEGISTIKFLSFNSNIEMSAWGYKTSVGEGLAVSPWVFNKTIKENGVEYMTSKDFYGKKERVGYLGEKDFNIHTHPGSKDGRGGLGTPSKKDISNIKNNNKHSYYILSKRDGITQYYPNGKWKKSAIKF